MYWRKSFCSKQTCAKHAGTIFFHWFCFFFWLHSNTVVHSVQFFIGCNFLWLQMDESFPGDQNDTWIFFDPKPWRKSIPPNSSHLGKWGNILGDCTIEHWGNQFFSTFHPNGIQRKNSHSFQTHGRRRNFAKILKWGSGKKLWDYFLVPGE